MQQYLVMVEMRDGRKWNVTYNQLTNAKKRQNEEIKWEGTKRVTIFTKVTEQVGDFAWLDNNEEEEETT